eukprot:5628896-Amphidinium_carterae.2
MISSVIRQGSMRSWNKLLKSGRKMALTMHAKLCPLETETNEALRPSIQLRASASKPGCKKVALQEAVRSPQPR